MKTNKKSLAIDVICCLALFGLAQATTVKAESAPTEQVVMFVPAPGQKGTAAQSPEVMESEYLQEVLAIPIAEARNVGQYEQANRMQALQTQLVIQNLEQAGQ